MISKLGGRKMVFNSSALATATALVWLGHLSGADYTMLVLGLAACLTGGNAAEHWAHRRSRREDTDGSG